MAKKICVKCHRQMEDLNFYTYKNGEKLEMCKPCLTMHVDNFDESTFLWILQKIDVPYIPEEWNILRDKAYAKSPQKMNGMSVLGRYLSKMKLKQFKDYTWADTEKLQEEYRRRAWEKQEEQKAIEEQARQQFDKGQISQAQYKTLTSSETQSKQEEAARDARLTKAKQEREAREREQAAKFAEEAASSQPQQDTIIYADPLQDPIGADNAFNENYFMPEDDLPDIENDLTLEDKQYLALKWGRTYRPAQWVQLEQKYVEMMNSFDIQDADSKNSLIFICKTYLKMNQAIDCGDVEGYQKLSRVYDMLRKSAKFTAAQNKDQKAEVFDSIGQLVAYCEKRGGAIPRYKIKTPRDIVDKVISDMKKYTKTLIEEDTALAQEIENYIKEAKSIMTQKKDKADAEQKGLDAPEVTDQDIIDFKDFVTKEKNEDALLDDFLE